MSDARPDYVIQVYFITEEDTWYFVSDPEVTTEAGLHNYYININNGVFEIQHDDGLVLYPISSVISIKIFKYGTGYHHLIAKRQQN